MAKPLETFRSETSTYTIFDDGSIIEDLGTRTRKARVKPQYTPEEMVAKVREGLAEAQRRYPVHFQITEKLHELFPIAKFPVVKAMITIMSDDPDGIHGELQDMGIPVDFKDIEELLRLYHNDEFRLAKRRK